MWQRPCPKTSTEQAAHNKPHPVTKFPGQRDSKGENSGCKPTNYNARQGKAPAAFTGISKLSQRKVP
jgi:hypothetical protein